MLSVRTSIVTIGVEMMGIDRHLDWQRCSLSGLSYYKLNKVGFEISFYSPFQAKPSTKSRLLNSSILIISLQFCLQLKFIFMKNDFSCKLFIWYKMHFTILKFIFPELYSYFDERKFDAHFNLVRLYNNCKGKIYIQDVYIFNDLLYNHDQYFSNKHCRKLSIECGGKNRKIRQT